LSASRILVLTTAVLALAVAFAPFQAWAPTAPKACGTLSAKGKRYQVKADQIRCSTARRQAGRYLRYGTKPRGYSCKTYSASETSIKFRCTKGVRVLFAIRR
jgi:hypothetical protein